MMHYRCQFKLLLGLLRDKFAKLLSGALSNRLRGDIKVEMRLFGQRTLVKAIQWAQKIEEKYWVIDNKAKPNSNRFNSKSYNTNIRHNANLTSFTSYFYHAYPNNSHQNQNIHHTGLNSFYSNPSSIIHSNCNKRNPLISTHPLTLPHQLKLPNYCLKIITDLLRVKFKCKGGHFEKVVGC